MMEKIVLKSVKPEEYGDEVITCKVIANEDIRGYVATIPEEKKVYATKVAPVSARRGKVGEVVHTVLLTEREGKVYIIHEEECTVGEREIDGQMVPDVVVTNIHSESQEQYVVKADKFIKMYVPNEDGTFTPVPDERLLAQVSEDIVIVTAWGAPAVCLSGSYITEYNAEKNDYNTLEKGAKSSTYVDVNPKTKKLS